MTKVYRQPVIGETIQFIGLLMAMAVPFIVLIFGLPWWLNPITGLVFFVFLGFCGYLNRGCAPDTIGRP